MQDLGQAGPARLVPLGAEYDHDQARQFAELVAQLVNRLLPKSTSLERSPAKRQRRVYLDYLQNRRGQTLAAPYSVRPAPGATGVHAAEVGRGQPRARPDPVHDQDDGQAAGQGWRPVGCRSGCGVNLAECVERLAQGGHT